MHGYKEENTQINISVFVESIDCYFPSTEKEKKKRLIKFPSSMKEAAGRNSEMINILYF